MGAAPEPLPARPTGALGPWGSYASATAHHVFQAYAFLLKVTNGNQDLTGGDITDSITTTAAAGEPDIEEAAHNSGGVGDGDIMKLDILTSCNMEHAVAKLTGSGGQSGGLSDAQGTAGDAGAYHKSAVTALFIDTAWHTASFEIGGIDLPILESGYVGSIGVDIGSGVRG